MSGDMCTAGLNPTLPAVHRFSAQHLVDQTSSTLTVVFLRVRLLDLNSFPLTQKTCRKPLRNISMDTTSTLMIHSYKRAPASLSCSHVFADSRDVSCQSEIGAPVDVCSLMPTRRSSLFSTPRPILNVSIKLMLTCDSTLL